MMSWSIILCLLFASVITLTKGECDEGCATPTLIYEDLKCNPRYASPNDCCPKEYDCSHIYNRPEGTCHLKGKFYKPGEEADYEAVRGNCHRSCYCDESTIEFTCPRVMDGCAEHWVRGYRKPGCYLKYELNQCCAAGQICPPFDANTQCEVNGVTYKEGLKFDHPKQKCTTCICHKGFDGTFEKPFCQKRNCTAEIKNSKQIDDKCAPFYKSLDSCCPDKWICPTENGNYIPASSESADSGLHCMFGEKQMNIGEKFEREDEGVGKVSCDCIVPPYLTCTVHSS